MSPPARTRGVLLGRDGVLTRHLSAHCEYRGNATLFLPRALEALHLLAVNGFAAVVVSHHSYPAGGCPPRETPEALTRWLLFEAALAGGNIASVYYCVHRQGGGCGCFQSRSGLVARALAEHGLVAAETFFVGEDGRALRTAAAVGCRCLRIDRHAFLQSAAARPCGVGALAMSLYDAVQQVLAVEARAAWQRKKALLQAAALTAPWAFTAPGRLGKRVH